MRRGDVRGLPAFTRSGVICGSVADLLFGTHGDRVVGLILSGGAWGRKRLIPYESVAVIGSAAVVVRELAIVSLPVGQAIRRLHQKHTTLVGCRILHADGLELGTVTDVCFDPGNGHVTGFVVSGGPLVDLVCGWCFVSLERIGRGSVARRGTIVLTANR